MSSNVSCCLDFNLISWSHDWCLNKVIVVVFSRNKCFQFLYMCDTCLVVSLDVLTFSRILKDAWSFSLSLISWLVWLVSMFVKSIFAIKVFLIKVANSFFAIDLRLCFSFVIELCRCASWIAFTQMHLSNLNIFLFQSIFELCFFNQNIFKTTSYMIIHTISKINFSWCCRITSDNDIVFVFTRSFLLSNEFSSMIIKSYASFFFRVEKLILSIKFYDIKFFVALESIIVVSRCSLTLIDVENTRVMLIKFNDFLRVVALHFYHMLFMRRLIFFSKW